MSKPHLLKATRIFIGSPGDIVGERTSFPSLLDKINQIKAKGMGVLLEPVGWEDTLPGRGRPQERINKDLVECDLIVMLLWKRWGSPTGEYSSGFEEEYELAHSQGKEMMLYFRDIPDVMLADPGEQLRKVLDFRNKIETEKNYLFRRYEDESDWEDHFTRDLCNWLDRLPPPPLSTPSPEAERQYQEKISGLEAALAKAKEAQAGAALALWKEGETFDKGGLFSKAEEFFAKAIAVYPAPDLLNFYGLFLDRIGSLLKAEEQFQRLLATGQGLEDKAIQAVAYGNLGNLYLTRGDLKAAEEMYKKSLAIEEELGRKEGMANAYGNLGNIYMTRGDLKAAEKMHKKSLAIEEELGRKEGMARQYGNLGNIYLTRGDLKAAGNMHKKSLAINQELGCKEGMARQYGNLGILYKTQGDLKAAEEMYKKAHELFKIIGMKPEIKKLKGLLQELKKSKKK